MSIGKTLDPFRLVIGIVVSAINGEPAHFIQA